MSYSDPEDIARADLLLLACVQKQNRRLAGEILTQSRKETHDRLLGCMLGLTAGDAVGCPVEGLAHRDIRARYGSVDKILYPPFWSHWRLPGLHSDDTQQALAILEAVRRVIMKNRSGLEAIQPLEIASELASLYIDGARPIPQAPFGCWRGTGRGYRSVVARLAQAQSHGGSGRRFLGLPSFGQRRQNAQWPLGMGEPSAGVGAIMRIPPIGVLWSKAPKSISEITAMITLITHTDPLATVAACAVAYACADLCSQRAASFNPRQFLEHVAQGVETLEKQVHELPGMETSTGTEPGQETITSTLIRLVRELVDTPPDQAMRRIGDETQRIAGKRLHPTAGFAPPGVAASLYFFVHDAARPMAALTASVNAGGDTDTIGAVVGAFSGTLHGPRAFEKLLPDLVGLDMVIGKVGDLMHLRADAVLDLIVEETFWTRIETGMRTVLSGRR